MKIFKEKKYRMMNGLLKFSSILIIFIFLLSPIFFVNAGGETDDGNSTITTNIENPLGDKINDIPTFIQEIIGIVLIVGIPIVALAIIYSGFLFVAAQGNSEKLKKAKNAILFTVIGAVLLLGAFVIANAIKSTVDEIRSSN